MKKIIITGGKASQRIDKFLKKEVFFNEEITRGEIIRQIKEGRVLVNGKVIKPSYVLKKGDKIELRIKNKELSGKKINLTPNSKVKLKIIYEDENIIVINKPAGLQVHPDFYEKNNTLTNALIAKFPEIKNVGEDLMRPGIIHRLDKDTSGVMIISRSQKAFGELKNKFKNREIEKKYLALVCGNLENKAGTIDKPIARSSNYKKQVIAGKKTRTKIRPAVTEYRVIKEFDDYSLIEVSPKTGRMHQIRVHMNSIGHPIVGDKIYGKKFLFKKLKTGRQLLHAKSIKFDLFSRSYEFKMEIPADFHRFLTESR
jgi:23S rRNA pseudouridine1911/1915/1917 synthase